jgi:hypothetical protein
VAGVGRGEIEPRKREGEMASAPPPGMSKPAPRVGKGGKPAPEVTDAPAQPLLPLGEVRVVVNRLSESHADMLRVALRDLGEARRILDPSQSR